MVMLSLRGQKSQVGEQTKANLKIIEEERVSKAYLFHLFLPEEITGLLIIYIYFFVNSL